jgi:hypothetical protein
MNKKKYLLIQGWAYAICVPSIIILTFISYQKFKEIDEFGIIFGSVILLFLIYKSYSCFKEIKNTRDEERAYSPPTDASKTEIISYYKRVFYISIPAFIILSIWIYYDLNELETGNVETVRLWAPIAFLYENGGYWLAILTTPILGIICWFAFWKIIKKTSESE